MAHHDADWGDDAYSDEDFFEAERLTENAPITRYDLTRLTCDFCDEIMKYALRFRRLDEEEFFYDILDFHMEKDDRRDDLITRARTCKLCAMVVAAMKDSKLTTSHPITSSSMDPDPYGPEEGEIWWSFQRSHPNSDRPMLQVVDSPMLQVVDSVRGFACFKFREPPEIFLQNFDATTTRGEHVSYDILKRWYDKCLDHGGNLQEVSLVNDLESATIRLIDVTNDRLCDIATKEPYLALSYVWGTGSDTGDKLMSSNVRQLYSHNGFSRFASLPRTVRDAFEVTKELGFQYLFVDRFCIMQDSSRDMAIYVDAMHEIYNKADITIVAAAGKSVHDGLPGTCGTPRTQPRLYYPRQTLAIDDDLELVQVYTDEFPPSELLEQHLEKSVWATRGWTYQEQKLSERMLFFTDRAVFWKCNHITLYEDCPHDEHEHLSEGLVDMEASDAFGRDAMWWARKTDLPLHINGTKANYSDLLPHKFSNERGEEAYDKQRDHWISIAFRCRVQEFCERTLTHQTDIARAFNGMIGAFKIVYNPLPVHHGLLTRSLPSELTWACANCIQKTHTPSNPHCGLRATDNQGLPIFPTWSWEAWRDPPLWFHDARRPKQAMRELDQQTAMITSIHTGTTPNPGTKLLYHEKRNVPWRPQGPDIVPDPRTSGHRLRAQALIFRALVTRTQTRHRTTPTSSPQTQRHSPPTITKLTQLGFHFGVRDAGIETWLQHPQLTSLAAPLGAVCLALFDSPSPDPRFASKHAVLLLVRYRVVDGLEVAFRAGLLVCGFGAWQGISGFFGEEGVVLC